MDKSIILKLVFDGACYGDDIKVYDNEDYRKNSDKFNELCEKLCSNLSKEEKQKIMWDLSLAHGGMESAVCDEYFKEGFRLGLILGAQNFLN